MTVEAWLAELEELRAGIEFRGGELLAQRELLFGLWLLFMNAPLRVRHAFHKIESGALDAAGAQFGDAILKRRPLAPPVPDAPLATSVAFAAGLLRGIEQAYVASGSHLRAPRRPAELATTYKGVAGYVMPFASRFRDPDQPWPFWFARRGLVRTRCLRQELSTGHQVDLAIGEPMASTEELHCIAALFDDVVPLDANGQPIDFSKGGKFVFHGAALTPPTLADTMKAAMADDMPADIIVFPELTMPPERVHELVGLLRTKPWSDAPVPRAPRLIVAGSWHQPTAAGDYHNRAPVLASNGTLIGWHGKHTPFSHFKQNKPVDPANGGAAAAADPAPPLIEDIVPSEHILVVAGPDLVVAIAICLDFCQEGEATNAYADLDVDLVLVASMGAETTVDSHGRQAEQVWHLRKTATFVAQQSDVDQFGYVYAMSSDGPVRERVYQQISRRTFVTKS